MGVLKGAKHMETDLQQDEWGCNSPAEAGESPHRLLVIVPESVSLAQLFPAAPELLLDTADMILDRKLLKREDIYSRIIKCNKFSICPFKYPSKRHSKPSQSDYLSTSCNHMPPQRTGILHETINQKSTIIYSVRDGSTRIHLVCDRSVWEIELHRA